MEIYTEGYKADDRRKDEEDDDDGMPATYAALAIMWSERDSRYTAPIKPEQIETVRAYRLREANMLPPKERGRAAVMAMRWYPPMSGSYE